MVYTSRICDTFQSFVIRYRLPTERLIRQGFWYSKLFKKFVRRHDALSSKYVVSVSVSTVCRVVKCFHVILNIRSIRLALLCNTTHVSLRAGKNTFLPKTLR